MEMSECNYHKMLVIYAHMGKKSVLDNEGIWMEECPKWLLY